MSDSPRTFTADSLDGSENPTGRQHHLTEPQTFTADDVDNKATGKVQTEFSEHPQVEDSDGTVSVKVVGAPETPVTAPASQAETA